MRLKFQYRIIFLVTVVAGSVLFGSCKKDKVPTAEPVEPSKWDLISGNYKVYDTNEIYLYDLGISYKRINNSNGSHIDSLYYQNFNGEFDFGNFQDQSINLIYHIDIGYQDTLFDGSGHRWKITDYANNNKANLYSNDTIYLSFVKTNINYYIEDIVPYFSCNCKQIAVKQH